MSLGTGGNGADLRIVSSSAASMAGQPLDLSILTSISRPSRAIVTRVTTRPSCLLSAAMRG
jgi:hypothetical protein